jgi:hypothetical protein
VQSLGTMGSRFHDALSGAATKEFGNVQGTLEATGKMLGQMNAQFESMQTAFAGVIQKAEVSTNNQLETGQRQTEALARLMEGLMIRLQESAANNVSSIRTQLTMVVGGLAQKVGSPSQELITPRRTPRNNPRQPPRHPVFRSANTSPTSSAFGTQSAEDSLARVIQMALRLTW